MVNRPRPDGRIEACLRGHRLRFFSAGGVSSKARIAPSANLLVKAMQIGPTDRVLDFGCGYGVLGIVAARVAPKGQVYLVDSDIRAVRACRRNVEINGVGHAQVLFEDTLECFPAEHFDVILCDPPVFGGKSLVFEWIEESAAHLRQNGSLYLVGRRDKGVLSYRKWMNHVFGNAETLLKRGGYRVLKSARRAPVTPRFDRGAYQHTFRGTLRCKEYVFVTVPGIFSDTEVDEGTKLLVQHMDVRLGERVLDLGCGYGPIGVAAADLAGDGAVYLVDADLRAVKAARQNLALNGMHRAQALVSDGFSDIDEQHFDVVLTNPPLHGGTYVGRQFIQGAQAHLAPGGRMFLVAMRSEGYRRRMRAAFGNVENVAETHGYTVLSSRK